MLPCRWVSVWGDQRAWETRRSRGYSRGQEVTAAEVSEARDGLWERLHPRCPDAAQQGDGTAALAAHFPVFWVLGAGFPSMMLVRCSRSVVTVSASPLPVRFVHDHHLFCQRFCLLGS